MTAPRTQTQMPPWVRRAIIFWWVILVGLWASLMVARQLRGLLIQAVLALFLSFAMEPVVDRLGRHGVRRSVATAITMVTAIAFFIVFLAAMGSLIANQLNQLAADGDEYINSAQDWLQERGLDIDASDLVAQLRDGGQASEYLTGLADNLVGAGTSLLNVVFQLLTISLFAYYFTADGPRLRQSICSVLPPARQHEVLRVWELAIDKTGAFISSRVILAAISAIFHWVVFFALDLPSAVVLAIWVGLISQFIPVIGIYIAGVVPALIALAIDPTKALWVVIAVVIYQQIENYGLQPKITAHTLDMHPAVAFAAVLAGTATFGASGALMALPFLATVQSFISAYVMRHTVVESPLVTAAGRAGKVPDGTVPDGTIPDGTIPDGTIPDGNATGTANGVGEAESDPEADPGEHDPVPEPGEHDEQLGG